MPNINLKELFGDCSAELRLKFIEFDRDNKHVYKEFERLSDNIKDSGFEKYSHWAVLSTLRYNLDIKSNSRFKFNNRLFALYVRKLIYYRPEFLGFYELRQMKSD